MQTRGNGQQGYDRVSRALHWGNAILAVIVIALALSISGAPRHGWARGWLLIMHMSLGMVILAVMLFWAGWRLRHPAPALRPLLSWIEALLARSAQAALFLLFIAMPLSGYVTEAGAGRSVALFAVVPIPSLVPASFRLAQAAMALHLVGEFLIYAVVALHVSAALMHGFIRRDGILQWMLPPRRAP